MMICSEHKANLSPFIKWPGGKRAILGYLLQLIPSSFNSYFEPFVGGGALFFALQPSHGVLSDNNPELTNCYVQVRDNPRNLIDYLATLKNTEQDYYRIRSWMPDSPLERAARLMYLTNLAFNGIHRLNSKGEFNVPYGHRAHLQPCDPQKIEDASEALSSFTIICQDFESAVTDARRGDLVYFDPPYTVAHGNNGFLKYNSKMFSWDDQLRLVSVAKKLVERGCKVIVSNANHPSIVELYSTDFQMHVVKRYSVIAASSQFRRQITECIFCNEV